MAKQRALGWDSDPVSADLSSYQYRAVYRNGDEELALCETETIPAIGILENAPDKDKILMGRYVIQGTCMAQYGGNVTTGDQLVPTTGGKLINLAAPSAGDFVLAEAMEDGVDGDIKTVLIKRYRY